MIIKTRILTGFLALALLLALPALAAPEARTFVPVQDGFSLVGEQVTPYVDGHLLVKFTAQAAASVQLANVAPEKGATVRDLKTGLPTIDAMAAQAGVSKVERPYIQTAQKAVGLDRDRWFLFHVAEGDMQELAARFAADPAVEIAQPEWRAFPAAVPNDTYYPDTWGHNNTAQMISYDWATYSHTGPTVGTVGFDANSETAWNTTYGDPGVLIAIIDSGVDIYHEDLNCTTGYDFGDNDTNPMDDSRSAGHGTCCAGVAAATAENGIGIAGAAPGCTIMPLKVADRRGSMGFTSITNALYYAADNGADVVSMSLGAAITSDPATDAAIQYAYNAGCTILAATGNENNSVISYPAINDYVIGVGAASPCGERKRSSSLSTELNPGVIADPNGYTCDGERWWGSNYGSTTKDSGGAVDVIAPTIIPATDISGSAGYDAGNYDLFFNGTSCATPYAAGVCGLIKSAFPSYTPAQVRDQLCNTAADVVSVESGSGWDRYAGYGMVDAAAAVSGGAPVENPPVAAFAGTPTSGNVPLDVQFTDQSSYEPTSWSWTFGDGGTSTAQNPGHTYNAVGTYTVSLTVSNAYGSDSLTRTAYISVTDVAASGTMHVEDIVVSRLQSGRKFYGSAMISIVDDAGSPAAGASVTAVFTGDGSGTLSGVTGTDGSVVLTTQTKYWGTTDFCFEVTNVTHASLTYDSGANLVTKSCEGGDVFGADAGRTVSVTVLDQNTPNPFNPMTEISFSLPAEGHARLTVYNVKGQVVEVLAEGSFGAGTHFVMWDARDNASGVYFYRLEAPGFSETRKMILLK